MTDAKDIVDVLQRALNERDAAVRAQDTFRITTLTHEKALLLAELRAACDALRNDFEPDNQSRAYKRAAAVISIFEVGSQ